LYDYEQGDEKFQDKMSMCYSASYSNKVWFKFLFKIII